jgi:NADH-quinone oxidoreductase subunit I
LNWKEIGFLPKIQFLAHNDLFGSDAMSAMDGKGIWQGMMVTLRRFAGTFLDDILWWGKRYYTEAGIARRRGAEARGVFTVQYPEEKLPLPEEFRFVPFLICEERDGECFIRCTSCGICTKVCPPQCIWITRSTDPKTGRPIPEPETFFIDVDICMNCGFCAEFCPFDAIKMDHDYELSVYDRHDKNIYDRSRLLRPLEYYAKLRPANYAREQAALAAAAAAKAARKTGA